VLFFTNFLLVFPCAAAGRSSLFGWSGFSCLRCPEAVFLTAAHSLPGKDLRTIFLPRFNVVSFGPAALRSCASRCTSSSLICLGPRAEPPGPHSGQVLPLLTEVFVSAPGECRAPVFTCAAKALWSFSVGTRVVHHSFSLPFGLLARAKECCP
jgi:hypothetical protein